MNGSRLLVARTVVGLALAPLAVLVALVVFPRLSVGEGRASALCFAAGAGVGLLALAVAGASADALPGRVTVAVGALGLACVGVAALTGSRAVLALVLVDLGLVAIAHAVGGSIGRRVAHPGHLLPACAVAAAADVASVIHPSGPSHAIVASERALSLLAIGFPVPGTRAISPVLGLGDLVFVALVLGVAAAHRFSVARTAAAAALGLAAAGALSACMAREVPALVPLGIVLVAAVPEARRLRREDRRTAAIAVTIAGGVVVGVLLSPR